MPGVVGGHTTYPWFVLDATHADQVAERFGLGEHARLNGPVAFGRLGEIWQSLTIHGRFAVKLAHGLVSIAETERDAVLQESVRPAGVPIPAVVRAADGAVFAVIGGTPLRVYEWVDVMPANRRLDLGELGQLLADIHAVDVPAVDVPAGSLSTAGTSTPSASGRGKSCWGGCGQPRRPSPGGWRRCCLPSWMRRNSGRATSCSDLSRRPLGGNVRRTPESRLDRRDHRAMTAAFPHPQPHALITSYARGRFTKLVRIAASLYALPMVARLLHHGVGVLTTVEDFWTAQLELMG